MNTPRIYLIVWPAFLVACGLEFMVFGLVDPAELHWRGNPVELSRNAVYSIGFVLFWAASAVGSYLTMILMQSSAAINQSPGNTQ